MGNAQPRGPRLCPHGPPRRKQGITMRKLLLLTLAGIAAWQLLASRPAIELGPGVRAPDPPVQVEPRDPGAFALNGYRITPLADFSIRAKVLSREGYSMGREAELSPLDLALGWGRMSDEAVLQAIDISQSGRWYRWRTADFPIPRREIETHSANMHMIPADADVEEALDEIRTGQVIELSGSLVRADADDGWRWVSSLSRDDTGGHACELVYVQRARIVY